MSKSVLLIFLLTVGALSYNWGRPSCNSRGDCGPGPIKTCNDPILCYYCGPNQVFNQDTLYCDCKPGYLPINGVCDRCPEGYTYNADWQQC